MDFDRTAEQDALRDAVAALGRRYGHGYFVAQGQVRRAHHRAVGRGRPSSATSGVNVPAEYGGGGGGITELAIVCEELAAAGCPLLLLVVSPAIAATIIARHGTEEQRKRYLPGLRRRLAEGGLRDHRAGRRVELPPARHGGPPRRRRLGAHRPQVLHLRRRRGARTCSSWPGPRSADRAGCKPALFVVPTDAPGLTRVEAGHGDRRRRRTSSCCSSTTSGVPADALIGETLTPGLPALFAGLNPERITVAAMGAGTGRYALDRAVGVRRRPARSGAARSAPTRAWRTRWRTRQIQVELARLMIAKAAALYDAGRDLEAGVAGNMAKYAAAEAPRWPWTPPIQAHGGNGMTTEYGVATLLGGGPGRPDRPGQPGDDPQLRRPARPRPGEVVLTRRTRSGHDGTRPDRTGHGRARSGAVR